jgi:hypothetical protein
MYFQEYALAIQHYLGLCTTLPFRSTCRAPAKAVCIFRIVSKRLLRVQGTELHQRLTAWRAQDEAHEMTLRTAMPAEDPRDGIADGVLPFVWTLCRGA